MADGSFEGEVGGPIRPPVDDRVVVMVRLPASIDALAALSKPLRREFGDDLVIRTDTGIDGWLVYSRPLSADSETFAERLERQSDDAAEAEWGVRPNGTPSADSSNGDDRGA